MLAFFLAYSENKLAGFSRIWLKVVIFRDRLRSPLRKILAMPLVPPAVARVKIATPTHAHATPTCYAHHIATWPIIFPMVWGTYMANLVQIRPAVARVSIATPTHAHATPTCHAQHIAYNVPSGVGNLHTKFGPGFSTGCPGQNCHAHPRLPATPTI